GVELAAVFAERPADDDASLPHFRDALDVRSQPPQERVAAPDRLARVRAGAVERRPDELRTAEVGRRHPRCRDKIGVAYRPREDSQAVAFGAISPADEAVRKRARPIARRKARSL